MYEHQCRRLLMCAALLALATPGHAARAAVSPSAPALELETGMHQAAIKRIAVDGNGQFLVTAGHDKTARIWNLSTGALLRTLRLASQPGAEGKLYAVAISPDARIVAVGGRTGLDFEGKASIYLFERESGRLLRRLGGLTDTVMSLAFSANGSRLALAMERGGVRLVDPQSGQELRQDPDYAERSESVHFDGKGRLVTSCRDGYIRLYDSTLRPVARRRAGSGQQPTSVRFSPGGEEIAVGFADAPNIEILRSDTLQSAYRPDTADVNAPLQAVAWSHDGEHLCAAGDWGTGGTTALRCWSQKGRGPHRDVSVGRLRVEDLVSLPNGGIGFATRDPSWGIITAQGTLGLKRNANSLDLSRLGSELRVDAAASALSIPWAPYGGEPVAFSVAQRAFFAKGRSLPRSVHFNPPNTRIPLLQDLHIRSGAGLGQLPAKLQAALRARLGTSPSEGILCAAAAHDKAATAIGTEWAISWYDEQGNRRWRTEVAASVVALNVTAENRLIVAASADGTIRWFRQSDGMELLALFLLPDRRRWVAWTPSGYYDASAGGEELIGWHFNRGPDAAAEFFDASHFRDLFHRPALIPLVLELGDEKKALAALHQPNGSDETRLAAMARLTPPSVTILSPSDGETVQSETVSLRVLVRSPPALAVTDVRVLLDGRIYQPRRLSLESELVRDPGRGGDVRTFKVTVPPGGCTVSVVAETALSRSEAASIRLSRASGSVGAASGRGAKARLLSVLIGVSEYEDSSRNLKYAAKDAEQLAKVLQQQKPALFLDVIPRKLMDRAATRSAIREAFQWLKRESTAQDVVIVYLAGHGNNDPRTGDYLFLPADVQPKRLAETALSASELREALSLLPAKVVLFLDTCYSGGVWRTPRLDLGSMDKLANQLGTDAGVVVFAAATPYQSSLEGAQWENGVFTRAIIEGLTGKAAYHNDGLVTVNMLSLYVESRVSALTQGEQTPVALRPNPVPDFPLAVVPARSLHDASPPVDLFAPVAQRRREPAAALTPVRKRRWLWPVVMGSAAAVTVGITLGAVLPTHEPHTDLGILEVRMP